MTLINNELSAWRLQIPESLEVGVLSLLTVSLITGIAILTVRNTSLITHYPFINSMGTLGPTIAFGVGAVGLIGWISFSGYCIRSIRHPKPDQPSPQKKIHPIDDDDLIFKE